MTYENWTLEDLEIELDMLTIELRHNPHDAIVRLLIDDVTAALTQR